MSEIRVKECAEYLKNDIGFHRLMEALKHKYINYGSLGGTIKISNLSLLEREALSGFLGKNYYNKTELNIQVSKILKAFEGTKYADIQFKDILYEYFGSDLITNKIKKKTYAEDKKNFFDKLVKTCSDEVSSWIVDILNDKTSGAYKLVMSRYNQNKLTLEKEMQQLSQIIHDIRRYGFVKQVMLASEITKNPHGLDEKTFLNKILTYHLCAIGSIPYPKNSEEKNILFYNSGILKDDTSNNTLVAGINALIREDDSLEFHKGWKGFCDKFEPHVVTLSNIKKIEKIIVSEKVYVFENPTVFNEFVNKTCGDKKYFSTICTNGQIKFSSLVLLDMIYKENCHIYYQGDFDPEGLLIADKLLQRYNSKINLYNYSLENYHKAISNEKISDKRLKQLSKITSIELKKLADEMTKTKRAGYQEILFL